MQSSPTIYSEGRYTSLATICNLYIYTYMKLLMLKRMAIPDTLAFLMRDPGHSLYLQASIPTLPGLLRLGSTLSISVLQDSLICSLKCSLLPSNFTFFPLVPNELETFSAFFVTERYGIHH